MRGDIQVLLDSPAVMVPQVKAEAIKILTVTGRNRERELPDVPTIAEVGFPAAGSSRGLVSLLRHARHLTSWPGSTSQRRPSWRLLGFGNVLRR